jgi:hypothetical protein
MKIFVTIIATAVVLSSSVQFAAAAPGHHQSKAQQTSIRHQRNNADAYASWRAGGTDVYESESAYPGGWSAPAGR